MPHDNWWTPFLLYHFLCKKYNVTPLLDVAADKTNRKCLFYLTKENDALICHWVLSHEIVDIWCNPPHLKGMTKAFIEKALEQWNMFGMNILMLVPAGVISRKYFQPIWRIFRETEDILIDPVTPRPKFLEHGGNTKDGARNDYITVFFKGYNA